MAEDEYYYEDEYVYEGGDADGGGGEEEETWETKVENKYADAKALIDTRPQEAVRQLQEVIAEDEDRAKWTFKALKMIARTYQRSRQYPEMVAAFEKMINFNFSGKNRNDTEKAINKFLDRCGIAVPSDIMAQVYRVSLVLLTKEVKNYEKLWFNVEMRLLQLLLQKGDYEQVLEGLNPLRQWCFVESLAAASPAVDQRKGSQFLQLLSVEIQIYSERNELAKLRQLYQASLGIDTAMPSPRVVGIIKECGGKMFMRQCEWRSAYDCFTQAFRAFDEAGDARRIACLKYLVLACMLSGSSINPFDTNEAKSYQHDSEIKAMTELIDACTKNDLKAFERVLKDKKNAKSILEDSFVMSYLAPLMRRVRLQVLLVLTKPYSRMYLARIAQELSVTVEEAEEYCVAAILDGKLRGKVDQASGALLMDRSDSADDKKRFGALSTWLDATAKGHREVANKLQLVN